MSRRADAQRPTEAELEILAVLWERGDSTVRDVFEALEATRGTGYTTVLKLMQIMARKGLVQRDESRRTHVYRAAHSARRTQGELVRDLIDRAFAGSASKLVLRALSAGRATRKEIAEIRRLLDEFESRRRR